MCEFCVSHGEGLKWYKNMTNYTRELFLKVSSEEKLKHFLGGFGESMRREVPRAEKWKRRFPRLYDVFIHPGITRRQKKVHFGQIVPIEDVDYILERVNSIVRLPCICRKVVNGTESRLCYAVGMDATHILKDAPDFSDFDRISPAEAKEEMSLLDGKGLTHSVWTFQTPFIGALCNCDRDCMAYVIQCRKELAQVMWRGEYVAAVDPGRCSGCRDCMKRCLFQAFRYDRRQEKCLVDENNCYGCGVCRAVCPEDALSLVERERVPAANRLW